MAFCCARPTTASRNASSRSADDSQIRQELPTLPTSVAIFKVWQQKLTTVESVAIAREISFNLTGSGKPEQLGGALVSSELVSCFGVEASNGP